MPAYFCTKTGARIVAPGVSKAVDPVNGQEECTADDEHVKTKRELREDAKEEAAADKKEAAAVADKAAHSFHKSHKGDDK